MKQQRNWKATSARFFMLFGFLIGALFVSILDPHSTIRNIAVGDAMGYSRFINTAINVTPQNVSVNVVTFNCSKIMVTFT